MNRHRPGGGYGHRVRYIGWDTYRLSWCYDKYYVTSRLRFPRHMTRDTDRAGAERFAKKWGVPIRNDPLAPPTA